MDNIFCTLFDSNYLDKGLVLYDSMCKCIPEFRLYVLACDKKCYDILNHESSDNLIVFSFDDLEELYPSLLTIKGERTAVEYNWTCSSWTIKYVIEKYHESICTYIDADMRFFSSPEQVFQTMRDKKCSVIIVPHRFQSDKSEEKEGPMTGYYCVEFNTFAADNNGLEALNWWADQCLKWCRYTVPSYDQWYGDQKYLNEFPKKFKGVYICDHYGVGLGPWNDNRMDLASNQDGIILVDKQLKKQYPLVIYHFAGVRFINSGLIKVSSRMTNRKLHKAVFDQYINEILEKRKYIKDNYGLVLSLSEVIYTKNPLMKFYHKYMMPVLRLRHLYNLYKVQERKE